MLAPDRSAATTSVAICGEGASTVTLAETSKRNWILLVLFIGVLMGALDIAIIGPALPAIQQQFGLNERDLAWLFTIYVLFNLLGAPLMAKLADLFGRRRIYALDVVLFALGSLLVALSPSFVALLLGRGLQGLAAGGIFPVASAVIGDTFPPEKRGSALGMIGAVFGLAFLIGPPLGGALLMFGWQWLFIINLPIAAIVLAMSLQLLPKTRLERKSSFDWLGMAVLGILLSSFALGLNRINTADFLASLGSLSVWPFLVIALMLLPTFLLLERRAQDPIVHLVLFRNRQFILAGALSVGAGLSEAAVVFVPALLVNAFKVTSSTASFMLIPVVLAMAIGSPLAGRLLDRTGSKAVVLLGVSLLTAGMLMVTFFATTNLVLFYFVAVLIGLGLSILLGGSLRYIMLNETSSEERTAGQGFLSLSMSIGQLVGGTLFGAAVASRGGSVRGYATAYLVMGLIMLLLGLSALALKGRDEELLAVQLALAQNTSPLLTHKRR